jgi:hypothetical protein
MCEIRYAEYNNKLNDDNPLLSYSYLTPTQAISSVILFLVVFLYFLIPEMRTLQNRWVVCQSATMAMGYASSSAIGLVDSLYACKILGNSTILFTFFYI